MANLRARLEAIVRSDTVPIVTVEGLDRMLCAAARETLEYAAKAQCDLCADGDDPPERDKHEVGEWIHHGVYCQAAGIHNPLSELSEER